MAQLLTCRRPWGSTLYDLGCSTGTTLLELSRRLPVGRYRYVGIDNAPAMLDKARKKSTMFGKADLPDLQEEDITTCALQAAANDLQLCHAVSQTTDATGLLQMT